MKLSFAEKIQILMLCELYSKNDPQGSLDVQLIQDAIYSGHSWAIKEKYPALFLTEEIEQDKVDLVFNILSMFSAIGASYNKLSEADKQHLAQALHPFGRAKDFEFNGFDSAKESEYLDITKLLKRMNRYSDIKELAADSHAQMLPTYKKMLLAYAPIAETKFMGKGLNKAEIQNIFSIRYQDS